MLFLTLLGSKVTISFKVRFRVGISASHYGANGAIYIAAGRKCPPVQSLYCHMWWSYCYLHCVVVVVVCGGGGCVWWWLVVVVIYVYNYIYALRT